MEEKSELFGMLVNDFGNPKFLREFSQRMPIIYSESDSRSNSDDLVSESFKKYYFGHSRYILSQSVFFDVAQEIGVNCKIKKCESNGFPIAIVSFGRFHFTLHYGQTPNEITCMNTSLIRKQHSAINSKLVQPSLFGGSDLDITKLSQAENIYANIIHGCRGKADSFAENGFLRIAIPCLESGKKFIFVENVNLFDVLQMLIDRDNDNQNNQAQPMPNTAMPKIRKIA
jgi:hypothetical protein